MKKEGEKQKTSNVNWYSPILVQYKLISKNGARKTRRRGVKRGSARLVSDIKTPQCCLEAVPLDCHEGRSQPGRGHHTPGARLPQPRPAPGLASEGNREFGHRPDRSPPRPR